MGGLTRYGCEDDVGVDGLRVGVGVGIKQVVVRVVIIYMEFKSNKSGLFYKYSKISQQQKFHLLSLVLKERRSIKEAARVVDINYSTAKTIIFFHRNHLKSYQFDLRLQSRSWRGAGRKVATFKEIGSFKDAAEMTSNGVLGGVVNFGRVEIVSSIGCKSANIDFNDLQTNQLDHSTSHSGRQLSALEQLQLGETQICQCERRQTRAQSAKQAAKLTFSPPAKQEQSYQDNSQQHKKQ